VDIQFLFIRQKIENVHSMGKGTIMSELQAIEKKIYEIQEDINGYEGCYQNHMRHAEQAKRTLERLSEELDELESQKALLQQAELTDEEQKKVMYQLQQLRAVVNSDIVNEVDLYIIDFSISPSEECYYTVEEEKKHLGELHILIPRTELTEDGLNLHVTVKTNRPVVKALIKESMNVEPEGNNYFWNTKDFPGKRCMKD